MAFQNSILAGGTLVREFIQSEGYMSGSVGWQIARDGSAEFNSVVLRGAWFVINGSKTLAGFVSANGPTLSWDDNGNVFHGYVKNGALWLRSMDQDGNQVLLALVNDQGLAMVSDKVGLNRRGVLVDKDDGFIKSGSLQDDGTWTESGWNNLTLLNSYTAHSETPQYKMMPDGTVMLRGSLLNGTTTDGIQIASLPAGFRPAQTHRYVTAEQGTALDYRHIEVYSTGAIHAWHVTGSSSICLDGIRFELD